MNHIEVEKKWKAKWEESKAHAFDKQNTSKKYYMLEMFTYPSAANLHIGHAYNFAPADTFARFKKMQGYAVFQPMGFDSFGLPAENYAIKTGVHPKLSIASNIQKMRSQLQAFGATYDWDNEVITSDPSYYKWTQWLFIKFFEKGLVYQKQAPVNWCVGCNTAIANEQAAGGECERCKSQILKKNMRQWFFKITDYAQRLLDGLDTIDWPERTKAMQRHWIGKSEGAAIDFGVENSDKKICIFTTRADTLFGASYVVIAPEHDLVKSITTQKQKSAVEDYIEQSNKKSEVDRQCDKGEKTGVFCGAYCIHPISGERLEIWIADYCLGSYGTGAVMGVPAHDLRDFAFATKYGLKIKKVIECDDLPFAGDGVLVNSGQFDGLTSDEARIKIAEFLSGGGKGQLKTNYRLRDWSVSRQRYWGCPIPIVHCNKCGAVTVTEADLPVTLPDDVDFAPSGKSPLEKSKKFMDVACPKCGQDAKRDSDTLDTFVCSSWYFLRYPDAKNQFKAFDSALVNQMLPVDKYVGGPEHACMHLLYARFFVKALYDLGLVDFEEPFKSLVHQGMILGSNGEKMAKSKGNTVAPDGLIEQFGADALRMYLCFAFNYTEGGPWNDDGIKSIAKFLDRVERIVLKAIGENAGKEGGENALSCSENSAESSAKSDLEYALNYAIKNVTKDIEGFSLNTALARIMELVNAMYKFDDVNGCKRALFDSAKTLVKLIAPFAPHFAEELFEQFRGAEKSVFDCAYPVCDEGKLVLSKVEIAVQINSKIVSKIDISPDWDEEQIKSAAVGDEKTVDVLSGRQVKKAIIVKSRLINLIV